MAYITHARVYRHYLSSLRQLVLLFRPLHANDHEDVWKTAEEMGQT